MSTRLGIAFLSIFVLVVIAVGFKSGEPALAGEGQTKAEKVNLIGQFRVPSSAIDVQGNYAYVVGDSHVEGATSTGLRIIDIVNPAAPSQVGFFDTPRSAVDVDVVGSYAYITDGVGLRIIDVSSPAAPTEVGFVDTTSFANSLVVIGHNAYIAGESFLTVDVAYPTAPVEISTYKTPGSAQDLAVIGPYAYVADLNGGLRILNIQNPRAPAETGYYNTPDWADHVAVAGSNSYVLSPSELRIINVTNPAAPTNVGFFQPLRQMGKNGGVAVDGDFAYIADGTDGMYIVNVADPTAPAEVVFYDTPDIVNGFMTTAQDVAISGGYIYLADGDNGLLILKFTGNTLNGTYLPLIVAIE